MGYHKNLETKSAPQDNAPPDQKTAPKQEKGMKAKTQRTPFSFNRPTDTKPEAPKDADEDYLILGDTFTSTKESTTKEGKKLSRNPQAETPKPPEKCDEYMYVGDEKKSTRIPSRSDLTKSTEEPISLDDGDEVEQVEKMDVGEFVFVPKKKRIPQNKDEFLAKAQQIMPTRDDGFIANEAAAEAESADLSGPCTESKDEESKVINMAQEEKEQALEELRAATGNPDLERNKMSDEKTLRVTRKHKIIGLALFLGGFVWGGVIIGAILGGILANS